MKKSKIVICVVAVTLVLVSLIIVIAARSLNDYFNKVPKIEPSESVVAQVGDSLSIDDLASIENEQSASIIFNTDSDCDISVSEDKQSIFVGTKETEFEVDVIARGVEYRDATIKIKVEDKNER